MDKKLTYLKNDINAKFIAVPTFKIFLCKDNINISLISFDNFEEFIRKTMPSFFMLYEFYPNYFKCPPKNTDIKVCDKTGYNIVKTHKIYIYDDSIAILVQDFYTYILCKNLGFINLFRKIIEKDFH